ncbi:glycosyltransferase [Fusobacterium necrophorum subsp. funduliforme]|nr:glycosyltransferase [Fusobacterium necrophorum]AVQ20884.1 glycosyltransferase [Fusobacterium necrophorum subsp. funduliforme]EYD70026.1 group 1 glycosyl transferase [Fusobacterium necrophorum subsp. funduliforme B35]
MKKILFYLDSLLLGGEQKIAIDYLNVLQPHYQVSLLVNMDFGEDNFFLSQIPKEIPISFVIEKELLLSLNYYKKNRRNSLKNRILYSWYLTKKRKARQKKIGPILQSLDYDYCIDFSNKLPVSLTDERVLAWNHSSIYGTSQKTIEHFLKPKYQKIGKIVVVSESMKQEYLSIFPEFREKIVVLPNFLDLDKIQSLSSETIPEQDSFFLCCSRLDPRKDIATIIRAFALWKQDPQHQEKLFILGTGTEQSNLEALSKSLSLESEITFLGQKQNPYPYMKQAKLFLHASLQEGFGLVLVEAMACGTPVIATDCPIGPKEILLDGKCGILVSMKNERSMFQAIQQLMTNSKQYEEFQRLAFSRVIDFSKDSITQKLQQLFS